MQHDITYEHRQTAPIMTPPSARVGIVVRALWPMARPDIPHTAMRVRLAHRAGARKVDPHQTEESRRQVQTSIIR